MAEDNKIVISFGAVLDALNTGLNTAVSSVKESTGQMTGALDKMNKETTSIMTNMQAQVSNGVKSLTASIGKIQTAFFAVTAVLAGGAAFKSVVNETINWNLEALKLAKTLGITTQEASILAVALDDTRNTTEGYLMGVTMLTRSLRTKEEAFKAAGIAVRDMDGNYRATGDIMQDTIKYLSGLKAGTDQNIAGQTLFGRAWGEVRGLMRMTNEVMVDSKKKAEELHLIVGPEGEKMALDYKAAMNDANDVLKSITIQVGNMVIPVLTQLGAWLGSVGPQALQIFGGALKGVVTFLQGVGLSAVMMYETIKTVFNQIIIIATTVWNILAKGFSGDFAGAIDAAKSGWRSFGEEGVSWLKNIEKAAVSTGDSMAKMWGLKPSGIGKGGPLAPEGNTFNGGGTGGTSSGKSPGSMAETSLMSQWQTELADMKVAYETEKALQGTYEAWSLEQSFNFWGEKLGQAQAGSKDYDATLKTMYALQLQMLQKERADYIAAGKAKEEADKAYQQKRIQLEEIYIDRAQESARAEIAMKRQNLETLEQAGQISNEQKLTELKKLLDDEYNIEIDGLLRKMELYKNDEVAYQKYVSDILKLRQKLSSDTKKIEDKEAIDTQNKYKSLASSITQMFKGVVQQLLSGTATFADIMKGIFSSVLNIVLDMLGQMVEKWILNLLIGKAAQSTTATAEVLSNAAVGAAAAAASVASIPGVGWAMAPGVMAETYAMIAAMAPAAAAAGGYDIPSGINPVTQLHQEEMVLPKDIANPLRDMVSGQSGGGSGRPMVFKGIRPDSIYRGSDFIKAMKQLSRDGHFKAVFQS